MSEPSQHIPPAGVQITATFNATDVPNTVTAGSRDELQTLLAHDVRKVIITTIRTFGKAEGVLNDRTNIIVLVDEAHRTQEGDLGRKLPARYPRPPPGADRW